MTLAVDKSITKEVWADATPLRWKSYKLERRTQSKLMALARAVAEANWMRSLWAEACHHEYSLRDNLRLRNKTP